MKAFFVRHGEKVFLAVVVVAAGYLFATSFNSLRASTMLDATDHANKEAIRKYIANVKVPPMEVADYRGRLKLSFDGRGIYEGTVARGPIAPRKWHEVLFEAGGEEIRARVLPVDGRLFAPHSPKTTADRGKVSLSWSAAPGVNVKVKEYLVYKKEGDGDWGEEPFRKVEAGDLSLEDTDVKPETEYSYRIRAVGVAVAPDKKHYVEPDSTIEVVDGEWRARAFVETARPAMTPSDIDFKCSNISVDKWRKKRAMIVVLRWNNESGVWDEFPTANGAAVGETVVGVEPPKDIVDHRTWKPERINTGYVVKSLTEDEAQWGTKRVPCPKIVDPRGYRDIRTLLGVISYLILKHPEKKPVKVIVGKGTATVVESKTPGRGASTRSGTARPPRPSPPKATKPKGGGDSILERMRKKREEKAASSGRSRVAEKAPVEGTAPATLPSAHSDIAEGGWKRYENPSTAVKLIVPDTWEATDNIRDLLGGVDLGPASIGELSAGNVGAVKCDVPGSGVIIVDKRLTGEELEKLAGGKELPASKPDLISEYVCAGVMKRSIKSLPGAQLLGESRTVTTKGGLRLFAYAMAMNDGGDKRMIARYCLLSSGRLYVLTFVSKEEDSRKHKDLFEKIAVSMDIEG